MSLFVYLKFAVFILALSSASFAEENATSSTESTNISTDQQMTAVNMTNASSICQSYKRKLQIDESDVEEILRLMHIYTTNVVEIEVTVGSNNNSLIFTWYWASEIGRTIISLIAKNNISSLSSSSSYHLTTLKAGIEKLNVVVSESEDNYGCLPTGINESEIAFNFLLHKLFRPEDAHDYKLCRLHSDERDVKQYNCCRVAIGNLTICADYSSIILEHAESYLTWAVVFLFLYIGCPLMLNYILSFQEESDKYKITDSPMALSFIFHSVFFKASKNPSKKCLRRLAFSLTVTMILSITFSDRNSIIILSVWTFFFTIFDIFDMNEFFKKRLIGTDKVNFFKKYLFLLTLPLNVKFYWTIFAEKRSQGERSHAEDRFRVKRLQEEHPSEDISPEEHSQVGHWQEERSRECPSLGELFSKMVSSACWKHMHKQLWTVIYIFFCVILYPLFACVTFSLATATQHITWFILIFKYSKRCAYLGTITINLINYAMVPMTCAIVFVFVTTFLNYVLFFVIGLYLNGSIYSPIVTPIAVFIVYSWGSWRSLVETKYLQLKNRIYEVCKECAKNRGSAEDELQILDTSLGDNAVAEAEIHNEDRSVGIMYSVNVKDGAIPEALYDKLRENILPYNEVLFYFFVRMYFVFNFCLFLSVMILLAQKSNISEPVQIMSTFAIATLPLLFTIVLAEDTSEQKDAYNEELKQEIDKFLEIVKTSENMVIVNVKCEEKKIYIAEIIHSLRHVSSQMRMLLRGDRHASSTQLQ